jgi:hypothetical protein
MLYTETPPKSKGSYSHLLIIDQSHCLSELEAPPFTVNEVSDLKELLTSADSIPNVIAYQHTPGSTQDFADLLAQLYEIYEKAGIKHENILASIDSYFRRGECCKNGPSLETALKELEACTLPPIDIVVYPTSECSPGHARSEKLLIEAH